jgi:hypothetical protein
LRGDEGIGTSATRANIIGLLKKIKQTYPDNFEKIFIQNNTQAPMKIKSVFFGFNSGAANCAEASCTKHEPLSKF